MRKTFTLLLFVGFSYTIQAQTYHALATTNFSQNWSNIGQITANDDWSGVPSIIGYLGDSDPTGSVTAVDPQTVLVPLVTLDVIANQANTLTVSGGVIEAEIADPTVGIQGSGTADAPAISIFLNTTGTSNNTFSFNARDIDGGSTDNSIQPIAVQYRVGGSGNFTNIPAGFIPDASTGPNSAVLVTPVSFILPAATDNQAMVEIRVLTTNAIGSDEWIGIDDITVTAGGATPITLQQFSVGKAGKNNQVKWQVNCLSTHVKFELQRSSDSRTWKTIYASTETQARCASPFDFVDSDPLNGMNYYRLKIIDIDATYHFSEIGLVINKLNNLGLVKLYPNLVHTTADVSIVAEAATIVDFKIIDMNGSLIRRESHALVAGTNILQLDLQSLSKGQYVFSATIPGEESSQLRFIKQ